MWPYPCTWLTVVDVIIRQTLVAGLQEQNTVVTEKIVLRLPEKRFEVCCIEDTSAHALVYSV